MSESITILALESSCDDTGASVIRDGKILSNIIANQDVHVKYGGVVPELASRAHQQNIIPVVEAALKEAKINKSSLNAVAFTQGPGLLGSLLVSNSFAKAFSMALDVPLIGVNHMQAHILAHFIKDPKPKFPFLSLTVSGGHTQIVKVNNHLDMEILGQTLDDAVGEAFDKSAKLLGLDYPGGPLIDEYAKLGDPEKFKFPISEMDGYNYSFSGIKTSILYFLRDNLRNNPNFIEENINDICACIQKTLIQMLLIKLIKSSKDFDIKDVAISGGVAANSGLRNTLEEMRDKQGWDVFIPDFEYCTDNAAMIAITAYFKYLHEDFLDLGSVPNPRMKLE